MRYVNYDFINQIKHNRSYYLPMFLANDYESKMAQEFGNYYEEFPVEIKELNFDKSILEVPHKKETDYINAIYLYENYIFLNESQASDERFWCGLALEKSYLSYLFYRWGETENTLLYRIVYHSPGKRGMLYHGLARLWWFVHLTKDTNCDDLYHLTSFAFDHPHIMEKMIYRNFSNSSRIRISIIKSIKQYEIDGGKYNTKLVDGLYKHISKMSATRLLDMIPENSLIDNFLHFLKNEQKL